MAENRTEKIITALMLTYAMSREEAQIYLGRHECEILTEVIETVENCAPPRYLGGWFRRQRLAAWMDGRSEAIRVAFSRVIRTHYLEQRKKEAVPT